MVVLRHMTRNIIFSENEFYHIYNRGNDKRIIFFDESDRQRFQLLLYVANSEMPVQITRQGRTLTDLFLIERGEPLVDIGAYCLMPNHFHLLLRERKEGGISMFMQKVLTGYTMYFNKKNERIGALFQGKFRATHVHRDEYLKYLFAYIHLNPVKIFDPLWKENGIKERVKAEEFLLGYMYSSYVDYCGWTRKENAIINPKAFPDYFHESNSFQNFISWWLDFSNLETVSSAPVKNLDRCACQLFV